MIYISTYPERLSNKIGKIIFENSNSSILAKSNYQSEALISRGIYVTIMNLITWLLIITVSLKYGTLQLAIVFQLSFLVFRYRFGGAHASNAYVCMILSAGFPIIGGVIAYVVPFPIWSIWLITAFSLLSAFINRVKDNPMYAIKNPEKKMKRQQQFYRQGLILILMMGIVQTSIYLSGEYNYSESLMLGQFVLFVNLYL